MADPDEYTTNELPPFIKTWRQMYSLVIATLFIQILLFYWITQLFS